MEYFYWEFKFPGTVNTFCWLLCVESLVGILFSKTTKIQDNTLCELSSSVLRYANFAQTQFGIHVSLN